MVSVGWNDQDVLLALGVVPVGYRAWFDEYPTFPWVVEAVAAAGETADWLAALPVAEALDVIADALDELTPQVIAAVDGDPATAVTDL